MHLSCGLRGRSDISCPHFRSLVDLHSLQFPATTSIRFFRGLSNSVLMLSCTWTRSDRAFVCSSIKRTRLAERWRTVRWRPWTSWTSLGSLGSLRQDWWVLHEVWTLMWNLDEEPTFWMRELAVRPRRARPHDPFLAIPFGLSGLLLIKILD